MKTTLRIALIIAITASLGLFSCQKEYIDRTCDRTSQVECGFDSNSVNVRVANFTGYPLCDFNIIYKSNDKKIYDYGTLKVGETSCYTKVEFTNIFPEVTFNLGTGSYVIPDTLMSDPKYNSLKMTSSGFYTFYVQIPHSLDSLKVLTTFIIDQI